MAESWNAMSAGCGPRAPSSRDGAERWSSASRRRRSELEAAHRMLVVEKMASLGKLAATVAHEINNPLAGICTYVRCCAIAARGASGIGGPRRLARRRGDGAHLEIIDGEAARCGEIVRNLLTSAAPRGARFASETLRPLLARCVMLVRHQAQSCRASRSRSTPRRPPAAGMRPGAGAADDAGARDQRRRGDARREGRHLRRAAARAAEMALAVAGRHRLRDPAEEDSGASSSPSSRPRRPARGGSRARRGVRDRERHRGRIELRSAARPGALSPCFAARAAPGRRESSGRTRHERRPDTRASGPHPRGRRRGHRARFAARLVPRGRLPRRHGRGRPRGAGARARRTPTTSR